MTDREIPKNCRDCKYCERYHEVTVLTMYSWTPWKFRCELDEHPSGCEKKVKKEENK